MKSEDVELAIRELSLDLPILGDLKLNTSQIAEIVQSFLRRIEPKAPWYARPVVRTIHGLITDLRQKGKI